MISTRSTQEHPEALASSPMVPYWGGSGRVPGSTGESRVTHGFILEGSNHEGTCKLSPFGSGRPPAQLLLTFHRQHGVTDTSYIDLVDSWPASERPIVPVPVAA